MDSLIADIGSRRELLVDQSLVEQTAGDLTFRLHRPTPQNTIGPIADQHGCPYRYMTVFQDGELYHMYYALVDHKRVDGKTIKGPERVCYAQSRNGIDWETPDLGLFEYKGDKQNNIVWIEDGKQHLGVSGFSPFKDENPNCPPHQRYKAIAEAGPLGKEAAGSNGLFALCSPDGVNWSMMSPELVVRPGDELSGFDSQNLAFWDSERSEYRLYRRASFREGPLGVCRAILTSTSQDFIHWSAEERLLYPGSAPEQLYTNNVIPYFRAPHLFVGFPVRYVQRQWSDAIADLPENERRLQLIRNNGSEIVEGNPTEAGGARIGTTLTDTGFMTSRDGLNFNRWPETFIRPGLRTKNNWFYPDNYQAWGMVTTPSSIEDAPDELSFYLSEGGRRDGQGNICRRYTLRVDGFVSAQATLKGGELVTKPLRFSGSDLWVNFSASAAGSIAIEVQDTHGWPIPGFAMGEGVELLGDDLERRVRWSKGADLSQLAGKTVKLRFKIIDADLFSFQFK